MNPIKQQPSRLRRAQQLFFMLFLLAGILNGSIFWLRRVGVLDQEAFRNPPASLTARDAPHTTSPEELIEQRAYRSAMYHVGGWGLLTKAAKDLVMVTFGVYSLYLLATQSDEFRWPPLRRSLKTVLGRGLILLMISLLISGGYSLFVNGWSIALAGARSFLFLSIALLGAWAVNRKGWAGLAWMGAGLLAVQLLLAPFELAFGFHLFQSNLFQGNLGERITGTLLQPSSLGVTAVLCPAAAYTAGWRGMRLGLLSAGAALLMLLSGSATAWILAFLFAGMVMWDRLSPNQRKRFGGFAGIFAVVLLLTLPILTGRANVYQSLWGRLEMTFAQLDNMKNPLELLFGRGLGAGTNAAANLYMDFALDQAPENLRPGIVFIADSTPLTLLVQIGVVGTCLFYGLLVAAAFRDRQLFPVYLILGAGSLTLNICELYPANLLMGFALAHSLMADARYAGMENG